MNDQVQVDPATLERLSSRLQHGTDDLQRSVNDATDAPDAGVSSAALAGALSEITKGIVGLSEDMSETADKVVQSRGNYQETDQGNAAELQQQAPH